MLRAGFYGTGNFAKAHAASLARLGVQTTACWGSNPEKTKLFAEKFGAKVFASWEEMLRSGLFDVLYIIVPPFAHDGQVELAAIERGLPFVCEKPVGLELELCRKIADAVSKKNLVAASGYHMRFGPLVPKIRELLAAHKLSHVRSYRLANCPEKPWWRRMAASGGMMVEQATHQVDFLRFMLGELHSVTAVMNSGINRQRYPDCDIYDSMECLLSFQSGLIGSVGVSCVLEQGVCNQTALEVCGEDFYLSLANGKLRYKRKGNDWAEQPVEGANAQDALNQNFLAAVAAKNPKLLVGDYAEAVRTLAATLAMNRSAQTGQTVALS